MSNLIPANDIGARFALYIVSTEPRYGGTRVVLHFPNGFGASVLVIPPMFGEAENGEIAVLSERSGWEIDYSTDITNDIETNLSLSEVVNLLDKIAALDSEGHSQKLLN